MSDKLKAEEISFEVYFANPADFQDVVSTHWQTNCQWIEPQMKEYHLQWVVVCGTKIVASSEDIFDFPSEERILELGREHGLIPFAYSTAMLPEEITGYLMLPVNMS